MATFRAVDSPYARPPTAELVARLAAVVAAMSCRACGGPVAVRNDYAGTPTRRDYPCPTCTGRARARRARAVAQMAGLAR